MNEYWRMLAGWPYARGERAWLWRSAPSHLARMSLFLMNLPMHAIRRLAPYDILKTVGHVFALAANVSAFDQFWLIDE
jgi:hypothetical protein